MLEFRILGPLEVVGDDGPVPLGGPKQRATLAILLLHAGSVVSVDRLADDLYAGAAPVTAVTQVQRQVSELRKALGSASVIETRAPGYALRLSPGQLDLERFENMAEDANRALADGRPAQARDLLNDAKSALTKDTGNFGGHRKTAQALLDQAIDEIKASVKFADGN